MITASDAIPGRLAIGFNAVGLVLWVWGVVAQGRLGAGGDQLAAAVLLVVSAAAWLGWLVSRLRPVPHLAAVSLVAMAVAGGALGRFVPVADVAVGLAALGSGIAWRTKAAVWVAAAGPLSMLLTVAASGGQSGDVVGALAAALGGLMLGISRRQSVERAAQSVAVEVSRARADAERARAELLAGRNHLARELHDVLAHTLSALSVQLEALDAVLCTGGEPVPAVRDELDRTKRLVREGITEARGAVKALREDTPPLEDQLGRLAGERQVQLEVEGTPRRLAPEVSLALYRVAQEALTNAVKHAPGAAARVALCFAEDQVALSVVNGAGAGRAPLADSGGGYGLQGIGERVLLLGGTVDAGPVGDGWKVRAVVPA